MKKIIPKNETANETQIIDSYMFVTGGRPAIMQRITIPVPAEGGLDPRIRFVRRRRNDQQCSSVDYPRKKRKPVAYTQCFLLRPGQRFLRALERLRLGGKPLQFGRLG